MLGVSAMPGLSDLLAGRVGLARAMQRTPRIPSLRVITTGGAATAAGLMQSQRLRDTLEALRRQAGYIVIEAPSTSSSADAQSLASLADAAILAVELRKPRRPALLDAAEQLRRVGTPLLGAVVLPRLAGVRADAAPRAGRGTGRADRSCRSMPGPDDDGGPRPSTTTRPRRCASPPRPPPGRRRARSAPATADDEPTAVIRLTPPGGQGKRRRQERRR